MVENSHTGHSVMKNFGGLKPGPGTYHVLMLARYFYIFLFVLTWTIKFKFQVAFITVIHLNRHFIKPVLACKYKPQFN